MRASPGEPLAEGDEEAAGEEEEEEAARDDDDAEEEEGEVGRGGARLGETEEGAGGASKSGSGYVLVVGRSKSGSG